MQEGLCVRAVPVPAAIGTNTSPRSTGKGLMMGSMTSDTTKHYDLGLLDSLVEDEERDINIMLSQALITLSTLPFHLTNDLWTWRLFRGEVGPHSEGNSLPTRIS